MADIAKPSMVFTMTTRQKIRRVLIFLSFLLFPVTLDYFSPYLIIDGASQGIIAGSFITFAILFITALIVGRAWCGWLCPGAGIQECSFTINNKNVKGGKLNWIKYFIWTPWIIIIIILFVLAGGFKKVNPLYMIETGISVSEPSNYFMYFSIIGLFIILAFFFGKRAFCHYFCWMAPFVIISTKIKNLLKVPSLHLVANKTQCKSCGTCDKNCPMSLHVSQMVQEGLMKDTECILCGTCVDNCPNRVIHYSWVNKKTLDSI